MIISTSIQIHKIEKLIVINHKDCGATKIANGKKNFTRANEKKIHQESFTIIKKNKKQISKIKSRTKSNVFR